MIQDLRDFIGACEQHGQLHRVKTEVDWNLELCHVSKVNEEQKGPALLYENVKDYTIPVFTSAFTTPQRLALCLEQSPSLSMSQLSKTWMQLTTKGLIKPRMTNDVPVMQNVVTGAADGYYRIAGKPAATLLHCGPGFANGLANLHNARRARSGIVNVVGDQATYHRPLDAPLTADAEGWARPVSSFVRTVLSSNRVGEDTAAGLRQVAPRLGIVHLSDTGRQAWRHDPVGEGSCDFAGFGVALREIGYSRTSMLEIVSEQPIPGIVGSHRKIVQWGWAPPG